VSNVKRKIALLVVAMMVTLLIGEILIRAFGLGPNICPVYAENFQLSDNEVLGYEHVPGSKDGDGVLNSHGMRGHETTLEKPSGVIRIACIGDSICYGLEVDRNLVMSARLESMLNERAGGTGQKYEVLNFGVTGYNASQIVEAVKSKVLKFSPDMIVYAYCLNDPQQYSFEMHSLDALLTGAQRNYLTAREDANGILNKVRVWVLMRYAYQALRGIGPQFEKPDHRTADATWSSLLKGTYPRRFTKLYTEPKTRDPFEANLDELKNLTVDKGIPVLAVVFPVMMHYEKYGLYHIHMDAKRTMKKRGFSVIDLMDMFWMYEVKNKERIGWDALHPKAIGHQLAAEAVLSQMDTSRVLFKK
jgi:lysophospholipase L1-like esterase